MRAPHRMRLGRVAFELMPGGWVRLARPVADAMGVAIEHRDLASFLSAVGERRDIARGVPSATTATSKGGA
jgi:hypothetical protein